MAFPNTFYTITVADTAKTAIDDTATVLNTLLATGGRWTLYISTATGGIRWRVDGTDPTTTVGHLLAAAGSITISGTNNIRRFRMIRDGSTTATVSVTLSGELT